MMGTPISHRWTLYVAGISKGRWWPYIWLAFALFWMGFYLENGSGLHLAFSIAWLILALVYVERRAFYEILQAKQTEIDRLKKSGPGS